VCNRREQEEIGARIGRVSERTVGNRGNYKGSIGEYSRKYREE
jgi:hypothetical protein